MKASSSTTRMINYNMFVFTLMLVLAATFEKTGSSLALMPFYLYYLIAPLYVGLFLNRKKLPDHLKEIYIKTRYSYYLKHEDSKHLPFIVDLFMYTIIWMFLIKGFITYGALNVIPVLGFSYITIQDLVLRLLSFSQKLPHDISYDTLRNICNNTK